MQTAQTTLRWVLLLANRQNRTLADLLRELHTSEQLAIEIARTLHTFAQDDASARVRDDADPPDGSDLLDRMIRAYYMPAMARKREKLLEEERRALEQMIAEEQAQQARRKK